MEVYKYMVESTGANMKHDSRLSEGGGQMQQQSLMK